VKNLSASYKDKTVFKNVSFTLSDSSFTALCGKNGSGKSTLLSLMAGIVPAGLKVDGEILVDGENVFLIKRKDAAKKISFLVQNESPVWNLTVMQFVQTGLYAFDSMRAVDAESAVRGILSELGIAEFEQKKIFELSGGEFQKCRLARCMIQKNNNMLFDEPSEGLDMPFQIQFLKTIKAIATPDGKTVLFSIHDINTASIMADNFLLFSHGTVIVGNHKKIFDQEILENAFETSVSIYSHPKLKKPQIMFF
ncbi:ABC transporter ATP-binding protein, partial [Treponema sp.]|uniref:ABC transporter ATP-binding protein n=1 Tax=Treponema sp. TaxID=166 RepID=UPI00298DC86C